MDNNQYKYRIAPWRWDNGVKGPTIYASSGSYVTSNSMNLSTSVRVNFDIVVELIPLANIQFNATLGGQSLWTLTMPPSNANNNTYTSGSGVTTTITTSVTPPSSTLPTMENSYWYHVQLDIPNYTGSSTGSLVFDLSNSGRQVYVDNVSVQNIHTIVPVEISNVSLKDNIISWKSGVEHNIEKYVIQGSNDQKEWTNLKEVKAENKSNYFVDLSADSKTMGMSSLFIFIMLLSLLFIKRNKAFTFFSALFFIVSIVSCEKTDIQKLNNTVVDYKFYRVQSIDKNNMTTSISNIVSKR